MVQYAVTGRKQIWKSFLNAARANMKGLVLLESKLKLSLLKKISKLLNTTGYHHNRSEPFKVKMHAKQLADDNNKSIVMSTRW